MWLSQLMRRSQPLTDSGWRSLFFSFLSCACLAGCAEEPLQSVYVNRIAHVLGADAALEREMLLREPGARVLQIATVPQEISALQFADLHRCDLGGLAGERNSSLGRLAPASQRLGYELRWQCRAPSCELAWLEEITLKKRTQLNAMVWNAIIAGPEMAAALTNSNNGTADSGALERLNDVARSLLAGEHCEFSQVAFEQALNRVRLGLPVKAQRYKWAEYRAALDAISGLLKSVSVCLNGAPTVKAEHLFAVFRRHYVQSLQPELNRVLGNDRVWIDALAEIHRRFDTVAPASWADFYRLTLDPNSPDSEWNRTRLSITQHAEAWQQVFNQCGVDIRSVAQASS